MNDLLDDEDSDNVHDEKLGEMLEIRSIPSECQDCAKELFTEAGNPEELSVITPVRHIRTRVGRVVKPVNRLIQNITQTSSTSTTSYNF